MSNLFYQSWRKILCLEQFEKKELDKNTTENLLQYSRRGILAVNGENDYPYAIPINYIYDREMQKTYFHGARAGIAAQLFEIEIEHLSGKEVQER